MKSKAILSCLVILSAAMLAEPALAEARVDLTAVLGKDFISTPSWDQAVSALGSDNPFGGLGWEVVMDHVGLGGQYLVNFHQDGSRLWWLDWNGQALYTSYHLFGARSALDLFVDTGIGSAGRVLLGTDPGDKPQLAISVYPFVSAGAAVRLNSLRLGAKLSYELGQTAIPATSIPAYPIGRFQVSALVGFSIGPFGSD